MRSRRSPFRRSRSPARHLLWLLVLLPVAALGAWLWLSRTHPELVPDLGSDLAAITGNGAPATTNAPANAPASTALPTDAGDSTVAPALAPRPPAPPAWRGTAQVIDGNTLQIAGTRIALEGIDAPELAQQCQRAGETHPCGQIAATALSERIGARDITCLQFDREDDGTVLARCWIGRHELNRWMVREGFALADRRHSGEYVPDEEFASIAGIGIWSGTFQPPWEFRRDNASK